MPSRDIRWCLALALVLGAVLSAGCAAGPRMYVNRDADMAYYRKVAVLPFANLSGDAFAGERVTRAFVTELIIAERFQLVDPGEFRMVLDRMGALPDAQGNLDPQKLKEAAAKVEATGVIRGAVTEYQVQRSGTEECPVLSFYAEMVDVATGNVVWRIQTSKKGKGRLPMLGGSGSRTFGRLIEEACTDAVKRLRSAAC
jgi:TolB-like protein